MHAFDRLLRPIWPTNQRFITFMSLLCLVCKLQAQQDHKSGENTVYPDTGLDSLNDFSMLTYNKTAEKDENKQNSDIDQFGYVLYCPCMGRFGNQAEQLIGSLAFAKDLNRTLVLPPFVVYPSWSPVGSERVPFSKWFAVKPLKKFHKVMTMETFMKEKAPRIWQKGSRLGFCYAFRDGSRCGMKDGNPFGPFWDHFGVDFDGSVDHPGILWDTHHERTALEWKRRFPPSKYLVYAFQGAPGDYPSLKVNQYIQKYIEFSKFIHRRSDEYIANELKNEVFVAVHLRNGGDMVSVCKELKKGKIDRLFCSEQCTGYNKERQLTFEMCAPSAKEIMKTVKKYVKKVSAKRLFIGTDNNSMIPEFRKALKKMEVSIHVRHGDSEADDPIIDIAIMTKADYFIGNCVSSFSAFVNRQRTAREKPVTFFGLT